MKKFLISIFIIIVVIVGIPLAILGIMSDGKSFDDIPTHLYHEDADAMKLLYEEIDRSLAELEEDDEADLVFALHQDVLNTAIFEAIRGGEDSEGINPDYLPGDDCDIDACRYVFTETFDMGNRTVHLRVPGIWTTFDADKDETDKGYITLNLAASFQIGDGFTYRTVVRMKGAFRDTEEDYILEFDRLSIGSLPFTQGFFTTIMGWTGAIDEDNVEDNLPFGTFDLDNLRMTIEKEALSEWLREDEEAPMMALVAEFVDIIYANRMLHVGVHDEAFMVTFEVSKLRNDAETDIPAYLYDLHGPEGYDPERFDIKRHMETRFEEFVFNKALAKQTVFTLDERTFNKILYDTFEGFEEFRSEREVDGRTMGIGLDALWFEFHDDEIVIKALFSIDHVRSLIEMRADQTASSPTVLEYTVSTITIGKDEGESEDEYLVIENLDAFKALLADIGDAYFGEFDEDGTLVIDIDRLEDLFDEGIADGAVSVESFDIVKGAIELEMAVDSDLEHLLDGFTDGIRTALKDMDAAGLLADSLNVEDEGPEKDAVEKLQQIQDALIADEDAEIDPEDVQSLFDSYGEMSPEAQETFMQTFEGLMDESLVESFNDSFRD